MLVFALLMDRTGLTENTGKVVVINKPEHQLPLFVVTFGTSGQQAAGGFGMGMAGALSAMVSHFAPNFGRLPPKAKSYGATQRGKKSKRKRK